MGGGGYVIQKSYIEQGIGKLVIPLSLELRDRRFESCYPDGGNSVTVAHRFVEPVVPVQVWITTQLNILGGV